MIFKCFVDLLYFFILSKKNWALLVPLSVYFFLFNIGEETLLISTTFFLLMLERGLWLQPQVYLNETNMLKAHLLEQLQ